MIVVLLAVAVLIASGAEACAAGLAGLEAPTPSAQRAMGRLLRKGAAE